MTDDSAPVSSNQFDPRSVRRARDREVGREGLVGYRMARGCGDRGARTDGSVRGAGELTFDPRSALRARIRRAGEGEEAG
jgi:hypothetical protein